MLNNQTFKNEFDDIAIINTRMVTFMEAAIAALTLQNTGGRFTTIITNLTTAKTALAAEMGDVDTGEGVQKGKTQTADGFRLTFEEAMHEEHDFIARALGGADVPAMNEFYPHGVSEYTEISRPNMAIFTHRINEAAVKYVADLGSNLSDKLAAFESGWATVRNAQTTEIETVDLNRTERNTARNAANIAAHQAVHLVAETFPGNVAQCMTCFDFSLLYRSAPHHKGETKTGTIAPGATAVIFNKSYTAISKLNVSDLSDNADMFLYLGATADALPSAGTGKEVKATKTHHLTVLPTLGNEAFTFMLIKNLSTVNPVIYKVTLK